MSGASELNNVSALLISSSSRNGEVQSKSKNAVNVPSFSSAASKECCHTFHFDALSVANVAGRSPISNAPRFKPCL